MPDAEETDQRTTRERLCDGEPTLEAKCPGVLHVYAEALDAARPELGRMASALCGGHAPAVWLRALIGGRRLGLADVFRLAMSRGPEARAYVLALLRPLVRLLGYRLEPIVDSSHEIARVAAAHQIAAVQIGAGIMVAQSDGRFDPQEAHDLLPAARINAQAAADTLAALERKAAER